MISQMFPSRGWKRLVFFVFFFSPSICFAYNIGAIELTPQASIKESYDDNITYASSKTKSDFIANIDLGLTAKYEEKTRSLDLAANLGRNFFANHTNFDNTYENLSLSLGQEISKYSRVSLRDTFSHSEEPRSFEEEFGRTAGRYSTYSNRFGIDCAREISRQLRLLIRYANETTQYSRKDLSDSVLNTIGMEADYALSSMTIASISYDFSKRDFNPGAEASTRTAAAGIRQYLNSRLFLDIKTGINYIKDYNNQRYQKPLFYTALINDIDENTRAKVSFKKEYFPNAYSSDIFNYWELSGAFTRRLSERLRGTISGFYGQGKYITFGLKDKLTGLDTGISYDLSKDASVSLNYAYSGKRSNTSGREYKKNKVSAGLKVDF